MLGVSAIFKFNFFYIISLHAFSKFMSLLNKQV